MSRSNRELRLVHGYGEKYSLVYEYSNNAQFVDGSYLSGVTYVIYNILCTLNHNM